MFGGLYCDNLKLPTMNFIFPYLYNTSRENAAKRLTNTICANINVCFLNYISPQGFNERKLPWVTLSSPLSMNTKETGMFSLTLRWTNMLRDTLVHVPVKDPWEVWQWQDTVTLTSSRPCSLLTRYHMLIGGGGNQATKSPKIKVKLSLARQRQLLNMTKASIPSKGYIITLLWTARSLNVMLGMSWHKPVIPPTRNLKESKRTHLTMLKSHFLVNDWNGDVQLTN